MKFHKLRPSRCGAAGTDSGPVSHQSVDQPDMRCKIWAFEVRAEWRRMAEDGPSAEELDAAKTFLTGSYPLRFSSSGRIANMLAGIQVENLGIDYVDRRNSFIEAVTLEDARRVARRLYDADALSVVVVGRPEGVVANREAPRS